MSFDTVVAYYPPDAGVVLCDSCGENEPDHNEYSVTFEDDDQEIDGTTCENCQACYVIGQGWLIGTDLDDLVWLVCTGGGNNSCGHHHPVHYTQAGAEIKKALTGELTCPSCRKSKWDISRFTITLEALPEDTQVRGNALASGNDRIDREYEDEIIARLIDNDEWAWCVARVTLEYSSRDNDDENEYIATDTLGGCTYEDKEDFIANSGYFEDMIDTCLAELRTQTSF